MLTAQHLLYLLFRCGVDPANLQDCEMECQHGKQLSQHCDRCKEEYDAISN